MAVAPRMPAPLDDGQIKQSRASLVGGIAVAIGVFALWLAILRDLGTGGAVPVVLGAVVAALIGLWIWKADL
ncbi:MAG: hypothetical protein K2X74_00115 [Acetobacteraceae bacterium]|nr:hypothetical protein [Acetobacteraceae bacterium]